MSQAAPWAGFRPTLALFTRSLRIESRLLRTYLKRAGLLVVIALWLALWAADHDWRRGAAGLRFFVPVAYINFLFISLTALGYFSSVITEEKEEMTLGLLKMSRLSSLAILLGKSTSRLVGVLLLLVAQFPFTLLAVTLGGVSLSQVYAAYATLVAYLVLLCNLALLCSVACKRTTRATGLTAIVLFAFLVAGPLARNSLMVLAALRRIDPNGWLYAVLSRVATWLDDASPLVHLSRIRSTGFAGPVVGFQVITNLAGGVGLFLLSWATFGLFTREETAAAPARGPVARRVSVLRLLGLGRPWKLALAWKDFHFLRGGRTMMVARVVGLAAVAAAIAWVGERVTGQPVPREVLGGSLMFVAALLAGLELIDYASRAFQQEVKWKTLAGLFLLPRSVHGLMVGKLIGLLPTLVPYAVYFAAGVLVAPNSSRVVARLLAEPLSWFAICQFVGFLHLVAYLSLVFKHSGTAAALGVWVLGNMALSVALRHFSEAEWRAAAPVLCAALVVLCGILYRATARRLGALAGQE